MSSQEPMLLYVVARDQLRLYGYLKRAYAAESVEIILDRRVGERRRRAAARPAVDRRRADRRRQPDVDERLRRVGWATILIGDP